MICCEDCEIGIAKNPIKQYAIKALKNIVWMLAVNHPGKEYRCHLLVRDARLLAKQLPTFFSSRLIVMCCKLRECAIKSARYSGSSN